MQLVKVLYCKLPTNGKQVPALTFAVGLGTESLSQRWEVRVLPLCHSVSPEVAPKDKNNTPVGLKISLSNILLTYARSCLHWHLFLITTESGIEENLKLTRTKVTSKVKVKH